MLNFTEFTFVDGVVLLRKATGSYTVVLFLFMILALVGTCWGFLIYLDDEKRGGWLRITTLQLQNPCSPSISESSMLRPMELSVEYADDYPLTVDESSPLLRPVPIDKTPVRRPSVPMAISSSPVAIITTAMEDPPPRSSSNQSSFSWGGHHPNTRTHTSRQEEDTDGVELAATPSQSVSLSQPQGVSMTRLPNMQQLMKLWSHSPTEAETSDIPNIPISTSFSDCENHNSGNTLRNGAPLSVATSGIAGMHSGNSTGFQYAASPTFNASDWSLSALLRKTNFHPPTPPVASSPMVSASPWNRSPSGRTARSRAGVAFVPNFDPDRQSLLKYALERTALLSPLPSTTTYEYEKKETVQEAENSVSDEHSGRQRSNSTHSTGSRHEEQDQDAPIATSVEDPDERSRIIKKLEGGGFLLFPKEEDLHRGGYPSDMVLRTVSLPPSMDQPSLAAPTSFLSSLFSFSGPSSPPSTVAASLPQRNYSNRPRLRRGNSLNF